MVQQTTLTGFDYLDGYFQDLLMEGPDTDTFMGKLAVAAAATLYAPGLPVSCGLTLHRAKKRAAVAGSDSRATLLDGVQNAFNDGPSLSAMQSGQCVVVPDVALERRWPRYISAAARQGVRSILGVPLQMEDSARAMLSLYSLRPRAFDGGDSARAEAFAAHAARAMRLALRITGLQQARDDMAAAMQSRTVIDVATGVLMAQNSCGQDKAFQIMRTASNNANVKLRDLAGHITDAVSSGQGITTHFDA